MHKVFEIVFFGKCKKKTSVPVTGKDNNSVNSKARQLLLTKLFRIGMEKAASADNLITTSNETLNANKGKSSNFHDCLNLHDRVKSASTGELSKDTTKNINEPYKFIQLQHSALPVNIKCTCYTCLGSSMNSVSSMQYPVPLQSKVAVKIL